MGAPSRPPVIAPSILLGLLLITVAVAPAVDATDPASSKASAPAPYWDTDHLRVAPDLAYRLHRDLMTRVLRFQGRNETDIARTIRTRFAPPPAEQNSMPANGTVRTVTILVDFPDAPAPPGAGAADVALKMFGPDDPALAPTCSARPSPPSTTISTSRAAMRTATAWSTRSTSSLPGRPTGGASSTGAARTSISGTTGASTLRGTTVWRSGPTSFRHTRTTGRPPTHRGPISTRPATSWACPTITTTLRAWGRAEGWAAGT